MTTVLLLAASACAAGPAKKAPGVELGVPTLGARWVSGAASAPLGPAVPIPMLPLPLPGLPAAPLAAAPASAAAPSSARGESARPSAETEAAAGMRRFDNAFAQGAPGPIDPGVVAPVSAGWTLERFESADGLSISYKERAEGAGSARVYSGGLALNESFEPLFASARKPSGPEFFLWTRAHPPTGWQPTQSLLDADARDLARMIVRAGKSSPTGKVELVLHSFGTLAFQRLAQLRAEPEAAEALRLLAGSRVVMLHATTHYKGSERRAGPDFERMAVAAKGFVDWLDAADLVARQWELAGRLNPLLGPAVAAWLSQWRAQRETALAMASGGAAAMMRKDLEEKWDPAYDLIRESFLEALARDARDPAWQEALLRRSSDMFRLEFAKRDAAFLRRLGARLDLVHSAGDALLNWASARALFERLGIPTPEQAPAPGAVFSDSTGRLRAVIVDGDHYWPLKKRDELARFLDP